MILNPREEFESYKEPVVTGIPDELKGYRHWVVWKLEITKDNREKGKKPTKVAYSPFNHKKCGNSERWRDTWGSFEDACAAFDMGNYCGVQFNITSSDPFVVIDFDHCVVDGEINDEVEQYIQNLDSYTEISPSGTGIHVIVRGKKPGPRCKRQWPDYEVEMYEHGRFITITGHVVDDKHFVNQDQDALVELYQERLPENKPKVTNTVAPVPVNLDDNALLEKIRKCPYATDFDALMSGNTAKYATKNNEGRTEADLSLCGMLAWWTGKDPERIDRIFRSSGLIRTKWDEVHSSDGSTYGQMTIRKAIEGCDGQYTGKRPGSNVVPLRKKEVRKVQTTETGFTDQPALFTEPYPWPDTGSLHYIDPVSGAVYKGHPGSDARDLIALRPIWIHSLANDEFNEAYRIIKFVDQDLKEKTACFPAQWFSKSKDANLWASLMAQGMITMSGKEKYVSRYLDLMSSHCMVRSWAASKLGWFEVDNDEVESNPVFILPDRVIGHTGDSRDVFFQSTQDVNSKSISARGTLKDWKYHIADKVKGNYLMMFAIAAGLAGGMTKLSGTSSGGFHFWGLSTSGKTTLLQLAASVWGNGSDPQTHSRKTSIRKWNNTVSGLEATAQLHNDIVLCLDEIGEVEPADLGKLIYNLTGGTPKGRSTEVGGLRNQAYWHIMLLSSGEVSTEQLLKSVGQSKRGGQTHRMPDIRIDALENGIVQTDPECPKDFVTKLKKNSSRYFGTAGPVFVSYLIKEIESKGYQEFVDEINSNIRLMEDRLCSGVNPLPREIARVLERMSAIAVAAMYAAEAGILDWCPVQIQDCLVFVRDLWLSDMEDEVSELDKALSEVRSNLIANMANFEDLSDTSAKAPIKMMGYKNYDYIMVLPKVMDDFCSYSKRQLLKELEVRNVLSLGEYEKSKGRYKIAKKIPARTYCKERPRCYWIARHFLDG